VSSVTIRIQGISLWAHHGMDASEKRDGGPFRLSIVATYREPVAAVRDAVAGRPDYAAITDRAVSLFLAKRFRLIEPLAAKIAEGLLKEFPALSGITVTIRKLSPVIRHDLDHVEVEVRRERAPLSR
jgi:dihydroneopterin aldolase